MNINVKQVKSVSGIQSFLKATENVARFMLNTNVTKQVVTQQDHNASMVLDNVTVGYTTKTDTGTQEHWYVLHELIIKELEEFFETREFETYYGAFDYSALMAYGIKLNITYDWGTQENVAKLKKMLSDTDCTMYGERRVQLCKSLRDMKAGPGGTAIEQGIAMYFGVRIDVDELHRQIGALDNEMKNLEETVHIHLGEINIESPKELLAAIKEKYRVELRGTSKRIFEDAILNCEDKTCDLALLLRTVIEYKKDKRMWHELQRIQRLLVGDRIPIGTAPGCIRIAEVYNCIDDRLVKPSDKYTIIQISTESQTVYKMAFRLLPTVATPNDYYTFIAAKAFQEPEELVTRNERLAVKAVHAEIMSKGKWFLNTRGDLTRLGLNPDTAYRSIVGALKSINVSDMAVTVHGTTLSSELKSKLYSLAYKSMYAVVENALDICTMLNNQIISSIRNHFGITNMRVRLLAGDYSSMIYEVANGEVEEFKTFLRDCEPKLLGGDKIAIEVDKVIGG